MFLLIKELAYVMVRFCERYFGLSTEYLHEEMCAGIPVVDIFLFDGRGCNFL